MSYDFFVFPAEWADGLEEARAVYESSSARGTLTPGGPMASFLSSLAEATPDGVLQGEPVGHDGAVYVATTWTDPMGNLATVAGPARAHGMSVLDVQLDAVYDPRGALDATLQTEAGPQLPFLTEPILHDVLSHILDGRYHWVNLARGDEVYVQSYRDEDGSWAVEHREGVPDQHFVARTTDATLVEELLWSWARDDGGWRAMLQFAPIVL